MLNAWEAGIKYVEQHNNGDGGEASVYERDAIVAKKLGWIREVNQSR